MNITYTTEDVRRRAHHYLEPSVAGCAGMTLQEMQQFLVHGYTPTQEQIHRLAIRLQLYPEPTR